MSNQALIEELKQANEDNCDLGKLLDRTILALESADCNSAAPIFDADYVKSVIRDCNFFIAGILSPEINRRELMIRVVQIVNSYPSYVSRIAELENLLRLCKGSNDINTSETTFHWIKP